MFQKSRYFVIVIVLIVALNLSEQTKLHLPDYLQPCSRSDPNLNICIQNSIELIKPKLSNGIPEMFIPPLDPLHLPMAILRENALEASFDEIKVSHLTENEIINFNLDLEKTELAFQLYIPKLRIETQYRVQGKVLILELNGKGKSIGNYSDVTAKVVMSGNTLLKNNKKYLNFDRAKVKLSIKNAHIYSDGLIQDPMMNDAINDIINANINEFLVELMPVIEATVEKFVLQITKKFFASFPLDSLVTP